MSASTPHLPLVIIAWKASLDRQYLRGAWYSAALAGGPEQAVLYPDSRIETHWGPITLPNENVLFPDITRTPRFMIAGQGGQTGRAWLWNGMWNDLGDTYGTSPCRFDHAGHLLISRPRNPPGYSQIDLVTGEEVFVEKQIGVNGIWQADESGVWSGDETYAYVEPDGQLIFQYTVLGDVTIGQGPTDGCHLTRGTERRLLEGGNCRFIHPHRDGDQFAIPIWKEDDKAAVIIRASLAELIARPVPPKPEIEIPVLGRSCWLAFFAGSPTATGGWSTETPPWTLPGNGYLSVPDSKLFSMGGLHVATYAAAEREATIEALNATVRAARAFRRPVIGYWPYGFQGHGSQPMQLPETDYLGPELYLQPGESPEAAESRWRALWGRLPATQTIVEIAQCYDAPDEILCALVPIYIRLARDMRVLGIVPFNGSGRAGGLQDRPDVRRLWLKAADGITGTPPIRVLDPPTGDDLVHPKIDVKSFGKTIQKGRDYHAFVGIGDGYEFEVQKDERDSLHFAIYKDGVLLDRSGMDRIVEVKG